MAQAKEAVVSKTIRISDKTQLVYLSLDEDTPFAYEGGKYIIANSQVELPNGKPAKRAYSIIEKTGNSITLSALQHGEGPGSKFMNQLCTGDKVEFSGPWGKLTPKQGSKSHKVIATDTGITAALGLVKDPVFNGEMVSLTWLRSDDQSFLSDNFVRESCPDRVSLDIQSWPRVGSSERQKLSQDLADQLMAPGGCHFYLVGDGHVVLPVKEKLLEFGIQEESTSIEIFFNKPEKK